jgi:hypothetical protein
VPLRIWHGREDRFVPVSHGQWLAEHIAGATAHILAGHGHLSLALGHFGEILDDLRRASVESHGTRATATLLLFQRTGSPADRRSRRCRPRPQLAAVAQVAAQRRS